MLTATIYIFIVLNHNIELAPDGIENICLRILAAVAGCTAIAIGAYFSRGRTNKLLEIFGPKHTRGLRCSCALYWIVAKRNTLLVHSRRTYSVACCIVDDGIDVFCDYFDYEENPST